METRMQADAKKDKLAYGINDVLDVVPVGRSFIYEEIRAGRLKAFKIGKRTLIADDDLRAWIASYRG
jgi:excisionase family DNA binding protein